MSYDEHGKISGSDLGQIFPVSLTVPVLIGMSVHLVNTPDGRETC